MTASHDLIEGGTDGVSLAALCVPGVDVGRLAAGSVLKVATHNSTYRFTVQDPSRRQVLIQGGKLFPEPTIGRIEGTIIGDGPFRVGRVQVGESLELFTDQPVVTSRVHLITVEAPIG